MVMILAALGASMAVSYYGPAWFRVTVYILAVLVVLVGGVMTFRDYSR
ncbi:putative integral membrane protein [Rhodococcus sp. MTM3W5.2]|nr:putative integral membrane protein [Rhodococcus sp. MTM3W5.2]